MSDGIASNYLGKCPHCNDIMFEGQHTSWNGEDRKQYHSSCLIEKLRKTIFTLSSAHVTSEFIKKTRHLTYLASPYTHNDINVKIRRYELAVTAAYLLTQRGELVFTPIGHTHPIALQGNLPGEWDYWNEFDTRMINTCDSVTVLKLDGWKESTGVTEEIKLAKILNKKLRSMDSDRWEVTEFGVE